MFIPPRAYITLAHNYRGSNSYESDVVEPFTEAAYHTAKRGGKTSAEAYAEARQFRANALAAHRVYRKVTARSNSQRPSAPDPSVPTVSVRPLNSGRSRRARAHSRARPAAPDEPPPSGLRKLVHIHSCSECGCSGSHALVRFEA